MAEDLQRHLGDKREVYHPVSKYFDAYANNLNRLRLHQFIDHGRVMRRRRIARASLVFNPLDLAEAKLAEETRRLCATRQSDEDL